MTKRLTKVERDVAIMKRLMALDDDDDDMVVDDTPPNSPGNNPPLPPPPLTNLPPPSNPPPKTPPPPPNSPPQSDAAKKGRIVKGILNQCKYADAKTDQPIPDTEVPQGTDSDIDSDNDQLNPRKRKASFSGGAYDTEVGSSSVVVGDPSKSPLKKKSKLIIDLN
ncbi:uncharacterized protein LOC111881298 [Lactuca sativa]|uniref:uncharacterized protein LOC111881298 n=1 Tax=Lactuca sativa TaxID=4236 RepID=UPI000CD847B0|nr:uncharacterized protein LOC111881298 [Lactuca sativa]